MKTFFEGHPKQDLHEKDVRKNFSGKFGAIRAKILRTPKNVPAPTPMVPRDVVRQTRKGTHAHQTSPIIKECLQKCMRKSPQNT